MWKPILVLAVAASIFFVTPSEGSTQSASSASANSSSYSSSGSSSSQSSASSSSSSNSSSAGNASSKASSSSNSSSTGNASSKASSSSNSSSTGNGGSIKRHVCPKNETLDPCLSSCPPRVCGVDITVILCQPTTNCKPGCRCRDGYLRNTQGYCVLQEDCPKCLKANEVYDECPAPCPPRLCGVDERVIRCAAPPKPGDPACKPGCRCADGYVRNPQGYCVTRDQCPPKCGKNEIFTECPSFECRPQECSQVGFPLGCPVDDHECPGEPACICDVGFVRNRKGQCIPIGHCPSCGGDRNAVAGCGVNCNKHCYNLNSTEPSGCIQVCNENGCDCRDGFYYDDNINKCVRPEECTPTCSANEVFSRCSNGGCGPWTCEDVGFPTGCVKIDLKYCKEGCVCKDGFVRENGTCIPTTDCPSCGGDINAEPGCGINCGRLCSNYNKGPVACPAVCLQNGCDCKKGYVFDENRKICVRPEDCTPVCRNHEVFSECINGGCDAKYCSQVGQSVPCVRPLKCIPGCLCEEGFLRTANGTCVPKDQCPIQCRGANEIYDPCPPSCPPQTCESIGQKYFCPLIPANKTSENCKGACRCKPNYLRNKIGECIRGEDCLKCTGPNEYFSCGGACDNVCATLKEQNQTSCPIVNIVCNHKCYCEEGYARDAYNICVPFDECPDQTCGVNERFEQCPDLLCAPQSCKDLGFPISCPDELPDSNASCPGPPGCVCDFNFVRDENGVCIPQKECPSCGGDSNAESGCGLNCGRLCSNYDKGPVPCPRICFPNSCDCKKDFVYDENIKKCVLPEQCTPVCGDNEIYSDCVNGGCDARNCTQLGKPVPCVKLDPNSCVKGCICDDGYLRAANGTCVLEEDCDQCNQPHEHYESCPPSCPPQTCESIGKKYHCPISPAVCTGACRCDDGFYRNKIGECICEEDCLKCTGLNEYFSCGGACDNVCATLAEQNQTNCPIVNVVCNRMCYCEAGYARDENNNCVPFDQCPPPCGENERYESCPDSLCFPQKCSELGYPVDCADIPEGGCTGPSDCVCIDNYVRDDTGKCIPIENCPSCGGDRNATSGCGINCGRLCSNYKEKNVVCPLICKINGCDCREGFVFDSNTKQCVRPEDCTPTCGKNEVYDTCANGGCDKRNCTQRGQPDLCIDPIQCIGGCVCQKGFLRTNYGTCVPEDQCPLSCPNPHEVYDPCPPICPPQTCDAIGKSYSCPANAHPHCAGACRCEPGYYRNANGECISESDCLKCTGPNEHFSCGSECDNVCATLQQQNQTHCLIKNKRCSKKCYCNEGYARDDNGVCIPIEQCGVSCHGDPNAVPGCSNYCGYRCSDYNKDIVACPDICLLDGCQCKANYLYDDNLKSCVRPEDCTPVCEDNEVYNECANGGCGRRRCSELGGPETCIDPIECIGDCVCVEGYLFNDYEVCVPEDQCKLPTCGPHEVYETCPLTCPPQTCESLDRVYICPIEWGQEPPCEAACVCEEGYYRNKIGECISQADCLKCMGPHEYFSCGGACDNVCATLNEQNQTNCPIVNVVCNPMCYCEKGYARNASNICIPIEDCPPPCTGANEEYNSCPLKCPPQTCESLGSAYVSPIESGQEPPCEPGCICTEGFYRNKIGECISKEDCLKCMGPNEYFSCRGACDNVCATLSEQNQTNCPIVNIVCNPMCYCEEGFARDDDKICIPIKECPVNLEPKCGPNERYEESPSFYCGPLTCSELGFSMDCPPVEDPDCEDEPACICIEGYVRNAAGVCIPKTKCPSCGNDKNAVSGCGIKCGNTCADYGKNVTCLPMCYINACDCREGLVYDEVIKKCVLYEDCTPTSTSSSPPVNGTEALARLNQGSILLALEFLDLMVTSKPDENSISSATSVMFPLAQIALFTTGAVLEQLLKVLNLNSKDEIKIVFPELTKSYATQQNVEFDLASKYYANVGFPLSQNFERESKEYFDASGENLDFSENVAAANTINDWVANRTRGKIQDLVSPNTLNSATRLVLVNAIYFNGNWLKKFDPANTETKEFYKVNGETVSLQMMYQENSFEYIENERYQALRMPYKGNKFSFFVILPRERNGLADTVKSLLKPNEFTNLLNSLTVQKVKVHIPKFETETQLDIGEMLKKVNNTAMFEPNNNDFKGILKIDKPLYISTAIQKGYITVNENGTEAAAATSIIVSLTAVFEQPSKIYDFNANHPFIHCILFDEVPMFCGSFVGSK